MSESPMIESRQKNVLPAARRFSPAGESVGRARAAVLPHRGASGASAGSTSHSFPPQLRHLQQQPVPIGYRRLFPDAAL
jgi:hypothetical protein